MSGYSSNIVSLTRNQISNNFCPIGQHNLKGKIVGHPCRYRRVQKRNGEESWVEKRTQQIYHSFCEECLLPYLLRKENPRCPSCNVSIIKYKDIVLRPFRPVLFLEPGTNGRSALMEANINLNLLFGFHNIESPVQMIGYADFSESEAKEPLNRPVIEMANEEMLIEELGFLWGSVMVAEMTDDIENYRSDGSILNRSGEIDWQEVYRRKRGLEARYLTIAVIATGIIFCIMHSFFREDHYNQFGNRNFLTG